MSDYTIAQVLYGSGKPKHVCPFFESLWEMQWLQSQTQVHVYPPESGNPISLWCQEIEEDPAPHIPSDYTGIAYEELDALYRIRSGEKLTTRRVSSFYFASGNTPQAVNTQNERNLLLAYTVTRLFAKKWSDLWNTMFYEFDPIENYNMIEQLRDDVKLFEHGKHEQITNNLQHKKTGTDTITPNVTTTETEKVYGFNSTNGQNANQRVTGQSGNEQSTYNTMDSDTGTSTTINSGSDTETHEYTLTRSGNIGVTTSQQMIEQQRKLLMFDYFNDIVFPDIDRILTIQVY